MFPPLHLPPVPSLRPQWTWCRAWCQPNCPLTRWHLLKEPPRLPSRRQQQRWALASSPRCDGPRAQGEGATAGWSGWSGRCGGARAAIVLVAGFCACEHNTRVHLHRRSGSGLILEDWSRLAGWGGRLQVLLKLRSKRALRNNAGWGRRAAALSGRCLRMPPPQRAPSLQQALRSSLSRPSRSPAPP